MPALGSLPDWLRINPGDYLRATQAGAQLGTQIAENSQRAWEAQQRMRMESEAQNAKLQQFALEQAAHRLAADRLEQYRQAEIANRQQELGIQQQGLGLRGEGLDIQRQRAEDALNLGQGRLSEAKQREEDRQAQRDFRNEIARRMQEDRDRALDLREKMSNKERPVTTKLAADEFGPELSGPVDSPEIVKRIKQRSDKLEAENNAPSIFTRAYNYVTGNTPVAAPTSANGSIPMNPAYPHANDVAAPPPSTNEVIRVTKDGRHAVYDANTKQFLRYAQ